MRWKNRAHKDAQRFSVSQKISFVRSRGKQAGECQAEDVGCSPCVTALVCTCVFGSLQPGGSGHVSLGVKVLTCLLVNAHPGHVYVCTVPGFVKTTGTNI